MASAVSSEKPRHALLGELARELLAVRASRKARAARRRPGDHPHRGRSVSRRADPRRLRQRTLMPATRSPSTTSSRSFFGTSLGVKSGGRVSGRGGARHHLRSVNRIRSVGGIRQAIERGMLRAGVMYEAYTKDIPVVVLCGSIRDDGPLPTSSPTSSSVSARCASTSRRSGWRSWSARCCTRSPWATWLPATVKTVCVDNQPGVGDEVDRSRFAQTLGIVMDASSFLRELTLAIVAAEAR